MKLHILQDLFFQVQFLRPKSTFPPPFQLIYYLARFVHSYKRRSTNKEREYNQLQHNKSRYLKLMKKLTKEVIKQGGQAG